MDGWFGIGVGMGLGWGLLVRQRPVLGCWCAPTPETLYIVAIDHTVGPAAAAAGTAAAVGLLVGHLCPEIEEHG